MPTGAVVAVIVGWIVGWTLIGAWKMSPGKLDPELGKCRRRGSTKTL
jgi:hypothetical protein